MIRSELRYAIWIAYGKKDIYSGKLIEHFDELEIDHVIPQSTAVDILQKKIRLYGLDPSFGIHSIENLVPTFKGYNRQKAAITFNESSERYFLAIAESKKVRVEIELSKVVRKQQWKEKVQFKKYYNITDAEQFSGFKSSYFHSDSLVVLSGYLPSILDELGSCAIEFYEMGSMITLNHSQILTLMAKKRDQVLEEHILYYRNEIDQKVFFIIGTSSLHLKEESYDQLLNILNDFLLVYEQYVEKFDLFWNLKDFEAFEYGRQYKLMEIEAVEWEFLIRYTYEYDIDRKNEGEVVFNANSQSMIAVDKEESVVKFYITGETAGYNRVFLLWHFPKTKERKFIENGTVWNARQTYNWLKYILDTNRKVKLNRIIISRFKRIISNIAKV